MTVTKEVIDNQLAEVGEFDQWFTKREINYLPEVIEQGESIKALTSGMHDGHTWLIVVTQRRVLFLDKGMMYGLRQLELPLNKIDGISFKTKMMFGSIEIDASGTHKKIEQISKKDVAKVAKILSSLVAEKSGHLTQIQMAASAEETAIDKLERLGKLKDQGILTQEEFDQQKKRLLEMI